MSADRRVPPAPTRHERAARSAWADAQRHALRAWAAAEQHALHAWTATQTQDLQDWAAAIGQPTCRPAADTAAETDAGTPPGSLPGGRWRGARVRRRGRGRRTPVVRLLCGLASAAMLVLGGVLVVDGLRPHDPPSPAAGAPFNLPDPSGTTGSAYPAYPAAVLGRSVPVHLDIPSIGVHTAVTQVGLNPDGTMAVPPLRRSAPAGWYRYLATPGEVGPAVIVGHVDSARDGPAVFYRLGDLRPGARITVRRADNSSAVFQVVAVAEYPKDRFPAALVYGAADYPRLTLVTCGGTFDQAHGRYRDSIIVSAVLTGYTRR